MSSISENLNRVRDKIAKAGGDGRVKLLAVSKTFSVQIKHVRLPSVLIGLRA